MPSTPCLALAPHCLQRPAALYHPTHSHLLNTNLLSSVITLTTSFNMAAHSLQDTHTSLLVLKSTPRVKRTGFIYSPIWWKKKLRCPGVKCLALMTEVALRSGYLTYMISTYNSITSFCVLSIGLGHHSIHKKCMCPSLSFLMTDNFQCSGPRSTENTKRFQFLKPLL